MNIARPLMSRQHRPAILATCALLFASVLMAGLLDESGKPATPAAPAPSGSPATPVPPAPGPRIAVDPPSFDFGRSLPQKALTREFSLRNFGDQDLLIESVSTSCGCAVADTLAKKIVKPGGSHPLRVTLTTPQGPGPIVKSVVVRSNDPTRPLLEIKLKTTVAAEAR
jgi:hypothetical protein